MQFIPLNRINPPAGKELPLPDKIKHALIKSCYDCHSNETQWKRIAYIAPASWLISTTVSSGRSVLNFSNTNIGREVITTKILREKLGQVVLHADSHHPLYYLWNPEARLTDSEARSLREWLN